MPLYAALRPDPHIGRVWSSYTGRSYPRRRAVGHAVILVSMTSLSLISLNRRLANGLAGRQVDRYERSWPVHGPLAPCVE